MKMNEETIVALLNEITEAGNHYDPAALFVGVFTDIDDLGQLTHMAQITEATGDASTRVDVTAWGAPIRMNNGKWYVQCNVAIFKIADSSEAQTIKGWFFNSAGAAGVLKGWGLFPTPIELLDEFSQITIVPRLVLDPNAQWSAEVVIDG